ncbi:MAG: hypothetical protein HYU66_11175 [Armatimonadetes bacterium]|nr:hypothetical protein [Armatimonadota bacterium]
MCDARDWAQKAVDKQKVRCPYLGSSVDVTDAEVHITSRHPELLPKFREEVLLTIEDPDEVRLSRREADARLFVRWFQDVPGRKLVVVVGSDLPEGRHFVKTAYTCEGRVSGVVEWQRV